MRNVHEKPDLRVRQRTSFCEFEKMNFSESSQSATLENFSLENGGERLLTDNAQSCGVGIGAHLI